MACRWAAGETNHAGGPVLGTEQHVEDMEVGAVRERGGEPMLKLTLRRDS